MRAKFIEYSHIAREFLYRFRYLKFSKNRCVRQLGIAMIDGRCWHGGMCDRFKSIISFYQYCESRGIEFKINYTSPFNLANYLLPNEIDWQIDKEDLPDSIFPVRPFIGTSECGERLYRLNTNKSILYYGNRDLAAFGKIPRTTEDWGVIFNRLFKPSPKLQHNINMLCKSIGCPYIAVVYRFQNLLGDFKEYDFAELDVKAKQKLIEKSLNTLNKIHEASPLKLILVTSDSQTFLREAAKKDYTFVIPGTVVHMDNTKRDDNDTQMKSFLDFFMISKAEKVYSIVIGDMYPSEFPMYAAKINNVPFDRVTIPN